MARLGKYSVGRYGRIGVHRVNDAFSLMSWLVVNQFDHNTYQMNAEYLSFGMVL